MTTVASPAGTLQFLEPLPGFGDEDAYTLTEIDPDGVLLAMRSVRDPGLRFVLTPAPVFFPTYAPVLPAAVLDALGEDPRLLLMLTIGAGLSEATANLRAPIAVGAGKAMQVVLDDPLPMHQPLLPA